MSDNRKIKWDTELELLKSAIKYNLENKNKRYPVFSKRYVNGEVYIKINSRKYNESLLTLFGKNLFKYNEFKKIYRLIHHGIYGISTYNSLNIYNFTDRFPIMYIDENGKVEIMCEKNKINKLENLTLHQYDDLNHAKKYFAGIIL